MSHQFAVGLVIALILCAVIAIGLAAWSYLHRRKGDH